MVSVQVVVVLSDKVSVQVVSCEVSGKELVSHVVVDTELEHGQ